MSASFQGFHEEWMQDFREAHCRKPRTPKLNVTTLFYNSLLTDWIWYAVTVFQVAFMSVTQRWTEPIETFGQFLNRSPGFADSLTWRQTVCHRSHVLGHMWQPSASSQPRQRAATWRLRRTMTITDRSATETTSRWRRVARRVVRGRARPPRRWTDWGARTTSWNGGQWSWQPSWGHSRTCCWPVLPAEAPLLLPRMINNCHHYHHHHRMLMLFSLILTPSALITSTQHRTADLWPWDSSNWPEGGNSGNWKDQGKIWEFRFYKGVGTSLCTSDISFKFQVHGGIRWMHSYGLSVATRYRLEVHVAL